MTPQQFADLIVPHGRPLGPKDADRIRNEIVAVIKDSVNAERERCAKMAADFDWPDGSMPTTSDATQMEIADRIRKEPPT